MSEDGLEIWRSGQKTGSEIDCTRRMLMVKVGDRIRMGFMPDDPNPIAPGAEGEVTAVNEVKSMGFTQIGVKWDNGRTLSLAVPPDSFSVVKRAEKETA
jgi:hypothetical protein